MTTQPVEAPRQPPLEGAASPWGGRGPWWLLAAWTVTVGAALAITLHAFAIVPVAWEEIPVTVERHVEGAAYAAAVPEVDRIRLSDPPDRLYENGRPTRFPMSRGWATVARFGGGRFYVGGETLYLSASDSTDPRLKSRQYSLRRPLPLAKTTVAASWVAAALTTGLAAFAFRRPVGRFLRRPPLLAPVILLLALVAANRAWFFAQYPVVAIHPDSGNYYALSEQIGLGVWPNFGNRPPMYPLFLWGVFKLVDRAVAVALAQTVLSVLGALALVASLYRWSPAWGLPGAGVMALFLFSLTTMEHDTAILSESLYTTFLMFSFAGLLAGLRPPGRGRWLTAASACMGMAILTRPAGMFLWGSYGIVLVWMLWNRYERRTVLSFLVPLPAMMLLMSAYNWRVVRAFAPSTWGEANLAVATFLYWETDGSYPSEVNRDILRIQDVIAQRIAVSGKDRGVLERSWDPQELSPVFVQSFNAAALDIAQMIGGHYETYGRAWIRRIALDSIRKRPQFYAKFVFSMLHNYFKPAADFDFRLYLQNRVWTLFVVKHFSRAKGNEFMVRLGKEYADGMPPPGVHVANFDPDELIHLGDRIAIMPTRLWRLYELTHLARTYLVEYWVWPCAVLVGLVASLVILIRDRGRNPLAFALFIVSVSVVGASLVVSLVEYSQPRYSYPMEWAYGVCGVLLLPVLFSRRDLRNAGC